jgi:O-antigen ligase
MSQKTYLSILKGGIYLAFISVFLVFSKLYFPFITSKQIYFNILIELLFVFWLVFLIKYPDYRPKRNFISYGLIAFFGAIFFSSLFGVDVNLSIWGDAERMLGFFHLLHFLVFYFILITVLREWKDWRRVFIVSIVVAVLVSLYGQIKGIHYSTIGNTAYVSGYMIFNIFFALILFFKEYKNDKKALWLYGHFSFISIFIMGLAFRLTNTRGAYIGIAAGFLVMMLLFIIFIKSKKIRIACLGAVVLSILLVGLVLKNPDNNFVKNSSVLRTITQINSSAVTFQTRLISWKAAWKDLPNHLLLGTGYGNYAITFDKYFEPTFYDYTRSETYFDRAHNNIVDITSTTGIIGIATYFSIFIAVLYYLFSARRKKKIDNLEFTVIIGLLVAYFVQNLVVFDSLVTYISLMLTLGYVYFLSAEKREIKETDKELDNKEIYSFMGIGILILFILFQYNLKPFNTFRGAIRGSVAFAKNDYVKGYEEYKKVLDKNSVLDRDIRLSLNRNLIKYSEELGEIPEAKAKEILEYAVKMAEKNIAYNPNDSLMLMDGARIYDMMSRFYKNKDQEKFYFYSDKAIELIDRSIEASPGRINTYYEKAQIYVIRDEKEKAFETLFYAYDLNRNYFDSPCNISKYYSYFKDEENAYKYMNECIDLGGVSMLSPREYVMGLSNHYVDQGDFLRVKKLYERIIQLDPKDAKAWAGMAKLKSELGDIDGAREAALKAAELDKDYEASVKEFIEELENNN